jgi:hypothetical protein
MSIGDGDNGAAFFGQTKNVTIRRNLIYGRYNIPTTGWMFGAIWWFADCEDAKGCIGDMQAVIENNIIYNVHPDSSALTLDDSRAAILVDANKPVTIRHNTIFDASIPILLYGNLGQNPAFIVENNIIAKQTDSKGSYIFSTATNAIFRNNNRRNE